MVVPLAPDAKFAEPTTETRLAALAQTLSMHLPRQLRALLLEFDGLVADLGADVVWSVAQIEQQNQQFRTEQSFRELYMPFDYLLFFGEDGGGDQFAFAIQADGEIHNPDIFRWEHETDARSGMPAVCSGFSSVDSHATRLSVYKCNQGYSANLEIHLALMATRQQWCGISRKLSGVHNPPATPAESTASDCLR